MCGWSRAAGSITEEGEVSMSFIPPHSSDTPEPERHLPPELDEDHPILPAPVTPLILPPGFRVAYRPRFPLHPNILWAILWCIGMLLFTQVVGAIVGVVYIVVMFIVQPQFGAPAPGAEI